MGRSPRRLSDNSAKRCSVCTLSTSLVTTRWSPPWIKSCGATGDGSRPRRTISSKNGSCRLRNLSAVMVRPNRGEFAATRASRKYGNAAPLSRCAPCGRCRPAHITTAKHSGATGTPTHANRKIPRVAAAPALPANGQPGRCSCQPARGTSQHRRLRQRDKQVAGGHAGLARNHRSKAPTPPCCSGMPTTLSPSPTVVLRQPAPSRGSPVATAPPPAGNAPTPATPAAPRGRDWYCPRGTALSAPSSTD